MQRVKQSTELHRELVTGIPKIVQSAFLFGQTEFLAATAVKTAIHRAFSDLESPQDPPSSSASLMLRHFPKLLNVYLSPSHSRSWLLLKSVILPGIFGFPLHLSGILWKPPVASYRSAVNFFSQMLNNFCTLSCSSLGAVGEVAFFPSATDIYISSVFAPTFMLTSEENMVAQVPIHQHTTGLVIRPSLTPLQILYSSVPPICGEKER